MYGSRGNTWNYNDPVLSQELIYNNYIEKLTALLRAEDRIRRAEFKPITTVLSISKCDGAVNNKNQYELYVPRNKNSQGYDAIIKPITDQKAVISAKFSDRDERVVLEFDKDYGSDLMVNFKSVYSDRYIGLCISAIEDVFQKFPKSFFFPTSINFKKQRNIPPVSWVNHKLNDIQKRAVVNILYGACRPHPYIIFGPPGTGKTSTLVETILQLLKLPNAKILVVAPTNSAVDEVTEKLLSYRNSKDMSRLASIMLYESNCKEYYKLNVGDHDNIILTTTQSSQQLGDFKFTHIIIDEAGKVSEPEAMIPLQMLDREGMVIMAGDHKQLGPYTRNPQMKNYGLHVSFMERLMTTAPYMENKDKFQYGYDERVTTMLCFNYRSLKDNVELTSDIYYNKNLLPTLSKKDSWVKDVLSALPPELSSGGVFVHHVDGKCQMDPKCTSYFNDEEALNMILFVIELFHRKFKPDDIGIITPYRGQKFHLTNLFKKAGKGIKMPKIGTVEDYQGREKQIILISSVRSNSKTVGFLDEPRRLNVMFSRAKILTVIFGNVNSLNSSENIRNILGYCKTLEAFHDFTLKYA